MDLVIQIRLRRVPELWSIVPSKPPHQVLRRQRTISNHFLQFSLLLVYFVRGSLVYSLSIADFTAVSALVANWIWAVSRLGRISSRRSRSEANYFTGDNDSLDNKLRGLLYWIVLNISNGLRFISAETRMKLSRETFGTIKEKGKWFI